MKLLTLDFKVMNGYDLSRLWFNWCFENPEKIKPNHTALYFFCIDHCNRLGWKRKFGLPTTMAKEAIGIKSYNTYHNTLIDLVEFGFIEMIEKSKNQYSSNIIALSKFDKALDNALDKANIKHGSKHLYSTGESTDSIDKQETREQETKEQEKKIEVLELFGFNEAPQHINQQRLVNAFFFVKKTDGTLEHFIEQFNAYKVHILKEENKKFLFNIFNFLGSQEKQFQDGKWQNENWVAKIAETTVRKLKVNY